jgi:hypothetical protein
LSEAPGVAQALAEALEIEEKVAGLGFGIATALSWRNISATREVANLVNGLTLEAEVGVDAAGAPVTVRIGVPGKAARVALRLSQPQ